MVEIQIVCGIVIFKKESFKKESILTIFKKKYNRFEFPGGKIEPNESLEEATIREAKEEIGCDISLHEKIGIYRFFTPSGPKEIHLYKGTILNGEPHIMEPEKFQKILYMPIENYSYYPIAPYVSMLCQDLLSKI